MVYYCHSSIHLPINMNLSDEQFDKLVTRFIQVCFNNDIYVFTKTMWRMSRGCHEYAYHLGLSICMRYGFVIDESVFDYACAEFVGDGCEIEWDYWTVTELGEDPKDRLGFKRLHDENVEWLAKCGRTFPL